MSKEERSSGAHGTPPQGIREAQGKDEAINWNQFILGMKRSTKEFIENVLENIIESIVVTNLKGYLIFFNRFSEEMFGYRAEEVLNRHIVILGASEPDVLSTIRKGSPFRGEIELRTKGGRRFPAHVRCVPLRDDHNKPIAMVGVARDLTEEKEKQRIAQEVARLQHFNRNVIASLNDGILIMNLEGRVTFANQHLEKLLEFREGEVVGRHYSEVLVEEGPALFPSLLQGWTETAGKAGRSKSFETSLVNRKGGKRLCWVSASPFIEGTSLTGVIATLTDISEIKRLKEELFQSEKLSLIGTLASEVAHEINNPLGGLVISVQMLLRDLEHDDLDWEVALEELREMENDARRCKRITQKLLDFSRRVPEERILCDPVQVIEESLFLVQRQTEVKNIDLIKDYQAEISPVRGNINSLQQVIINLVKNARDAMPEGGTITVSAVMQSLDDGNGWILISVGDTGPGLTGAAAENAFAPFFTTKPGGKGTGLGLAVSKRIVEDHGGRISWENKEEGGALFHVLLPASEKRGESRDG